MLALCFLVTILNFTPFWAVAVPSPVCRQCYQHKCDGNNICLNGCIPGYAGVKCLNKCPRNCIDSICDYDGKTGTYPCSIGCIPGYHGLQCNTPCKGIEEGEKCDRFSGTTPDCGGSKYGKDCGTSCEPICGGFACDNTGKCIKVACVPGRYGADCSKHCQLKCEQCHRNTGKCLQPYAEKDPRNNLKCSCDNNGTAQEKQTGIFIAIIAMLVFISCSWIFHCYEKYLWNTTPKSVGEHAEKKTNPDDTRSDQQKERGREIPETPQDVLPHKMTSKKNVKRRNQEKRKQTIPEGASLMSNGNK